MNDHFVNIKVDREERPDIDAVYMRATQAMTGQGGWPMTCILTPDGEPFFAGTYFPPEPRQGMPAFTQVLQALADAWENRRDDVRAVTVDILAHLRQASDLGGDALEAQDLDAAAATLSNQHDDEAGGFGASPKFPPSMVLEFLLRQHARSGDERSLEMVRITCEAMARGGIYDQLAGGFARYGVDRYWQVPHFEKMLYDNALLLRIYLHLWRATGSPVAERVARETARFMIDELGTGEGGFASALDADSEGHEGTFYVWNPNQLMRVLGAGDAAWAATLLGVTGTGTFERGFSTLQLRDDPDDPDRWADVRDRLLAARAERTRPARDDKVVAAWNGLAITALAEASVLLDDPTLADAAVTAAQLLVDVHGAGTGEFVRASRDGVAGRHAAVLEDHGCVAEAFVAVLGITGDPVWLDRAQVLLDAVLDRFADPSGGFYDTADDAEALVVRPQDVTDNATPSGTSSVVAALVAFAAVTGEHRYREAAEAGLATAAEVARQAPRFAGWSLVAAEAMLAGPAEVAVVGSRPERDELHRAALRLTTPGAVVVAGEAGMAVPLFEGKTEIDGKPAVYVCRDFACQMPVTNPADVR
jgi:uncharacterized protein YyaL (SSP411 family)